MSYKYEVAAVLALLFGGIASAAAQQPAPQPMPPNGAPGAGMQMGMQRMERMHSMMAGAMGPMMGDFIELHAFQPKNLLNHTTALSLSTSQVDRLSQIDSDATKAIDQARASHQSHLKELHDALNATTPDLKAVKAHFDAAHDAAGTMHWAAINAALSARAVLTDVQRARVAGWIDAMRHEHMGAGPGMQHPMMPGMVPDNRAPMHAHPDSSMHGTHR